MTGSAAAAAGLGFLALLVLSIAAAIPNVGRFLPGGLAAPALALATGAPVEVADVLTPVVATIVLIAACLAARLVVPPSGALSRTRPSRAVRRSAVARSRATSAAS